MRAFALAAALLATAAYADGLVDNVNGYTIDTKGKLERFTGILIDARGKVAKLLDRGDKRPEKLDFKLDARGRTLIPGLIDAHGHVAALGFHAMQLDLSDTRTLAEAQAKLARWSADHPNPRWIVGRGWDEAKWGLGRPPTAADIDAAVADRPVWLERADGHAGVANSAALAMAKAPGDDRGLFAELAMTLVTRIIPPPLPRERDAAVAKAQELLLASGVTAIADMGTTAEDWNSFRRVGDAGALRVRIISYAAGIEPLIAIAGGSPTPWLYDGRLRMVGVQLQADGRKRSAQYDDDARLRNLMSRAAMDGFQVAIRAVGGDANRQSLDAIDELALTYKGDRRWRIEHDAVVDSADLPRLGKNGIIASMQPAYRVENPNPFPVMAGAISREGTLAAFTSVAAHAGFADDRMGILAPGKNADFVLIDRDIFAAIPADIGTARVVETWIGGVRAWIRK